jgi:hypothetical protein
LGGNVISSRRQLAGLRFRGTGLLAERGDGRVLLVGSHGANAMIVIARIAGGILVTIAAINGLLFFGSLLLALFTWSASPLIITLPCFVVGMILIAATDRIDLWERRETERQEALKKAKGHRLAAPQASSRRTQQPAQASVAPYPPIEGPLVTQRSPQVSQKLAFGQLVALGVGTFVLALATLALSLWSIG